ncbi:hypothetical protein NP493_457g05011 [Ridgeia piscesae]|uniref:Uncharacterized protein n=1 Tax=Ridgeia piscesae TaxID=27915 RepID=A0AAD9NTG7_RIDPI|nr:hypothetical protein NP493_457g05011 [Ridgeia piscesae]
MLLTTPRTALSFCFCPISDWVTSGISTWSLAKHSISFCRIWPSKRSSSRSFTMILWSASSSLIQSINSFVSSFSFVFPSCADFSIIDRSSNSPIWYPSGPRAGSEGLVGDSMAFFPSVAISWASLTFFFLAIVPSFSKKDSPLFFVGLGEAIFGAGSKH